MFSKQVILFLILWVVILILTAHSALTVWNNPKKFIQKFRKSRHLHLKIFPFLRKFTYYPDENYVLKYNQVLLPFTFLLVLLLPIIFFINALLNAGK
jgi:hypothetical protein